MADETAKLDSTISYIAPNILVVIGMAGAGKTSFISTLIGQKALENPYLINLDPACKNLPYDVHIDVRDTVNYLELMRTYELGPNGAIVCALNMFASSKLPQLVEKIRGAGERGHKWCIIDTPGQIEVFTWSASGHILSETLAKSFRTSIVYVLDVVRAQCPSTFMSNMLYACSVLYKMRLPFLVVLNKIDLRPCALIEKWITEPDSFQEALEQQRSHGGTAHANNLTRRLSLTLESFYETLRTCGVSAKTAAGYDKLMPLLEESVHSMDSYRPSAQQGLNITRVSSKPQKDPGVRLESSGTPLSFNYARLDVDAETEAAASNVYLVSHTSPLTEQPDEI